MKWSESRHSQQLAEEGMRWKQGQNLYFTICSTMWDSMGPQLPPKQLMISCVFLNLCIVQRCCHSCCPFHPQNWMDPLLSGILSAPSLLGSQKSLDHQPALWVFLSFLAKLLYPGRRVAFAGFEELSSLYKRQIVFQQCESWVWEPLFKLSCAGFCDKLRLLFCFVFLPWRGNQMQQASLWWAVSDVAKATKSGSSSDGS